MKQIRAAQFSEEVLEVETPVLVDFYTPECGPCQQAAPLVEEIEAENRGALKAVKVDASVDPDLAAAFRISAVPTFVLFRKGAPVGQTSGFRSKKALESWIRETLVRQSA